MFTEAIEDILRDHATPAALRAIEGGASPAPLWATLADAGFLELMAPESAGGAALPLPAIGPVCTLFGSHALPLPAAQAIAARALLAPTGKAAPAGMITLAGQCLRGADGTITAPLLPFGAIADWVLANVEGGMLLLDASQASRQPSGVHGSLAATLVWAAGDLPGPAGDHGERVRDFSAAIHAAAMAGAMGRVFDMTLQYCNDRSQFGKSIGKFQAVQHQLSVMAQHVAAAGIAAELAFAGDGPLPARMPVAIAKARTSMAVPLVAATAHALHGAIGVTEEYDLHLYTRRLHEWRMADGSEAYWNRLAGQALLAQPQATITDFVRETLAA